MSELAETDIAYNEGVNAALRVLHDRRRNEKITRSHHRMKSVAMIASLREDMLEEIIEQIESLRMAPE